VPPQVLMMETAAKAHANSGEFRGNSHVYPELAAAGLWTTPTDLARFAIAIQRSVRGDARTAQSRITKTQGFHL
jgi:hypothetical protein